MSDIESKKTIKWYTQNASQYVRSISNLVSVDQVDAFCRLLSSGARILDAGCGGGRDSSFLDEKGAYRVIGTDLSKGMIREAARQNPSLYFFIASHLGLPFRES